jgi:hypothetical protein
LAGLRDGKAWSLVQALESRPNKAVKLLKTMGDNLSSRYVIENRTFRLLKAIHHSENDIQEGAK